MAMINQNFDQLANNYLFAEIANRVAAYKKENPDADIISMGIGDVTRPLVPAVVDAIRAAGEEMGAAETFHGYGPYEGYAFLREAISGYYNELGVGIGADEIFIGDGAKNDLGAILDLFRQGVTAAIPDPVYPAYLDVNAITGNTVRFLDGNEVNGFLPAPPDYDVDLVYLCSPNNPTGAVYDCAGLTSWVDYANRCGAVILFDAAYESFISDPALPRSIFAIDGARTCAIELCSLSKTAGFTGTRCGYTVIPKELERDGKRLRDLWIRRIAIKYNGTSYIIQKAAAAVFSPQGREQIRQNTETYLQNAHVIGEALASLGIRYVGGDNSPYIWFQCPDGYRSWDVFDLLLRQAHIVCTPGAGFGKNGEGWVRLTAFGTPDNTIRAMERVRKVFSV